MLYSIIRKLLFTLPPEVAHHVTLSALRYAQLRQSAPFKGQKTTCLGLTFENPIGLAAGLDKDGHCIDGLGALGFGFIEIGTVTPRPQSGNPKPRLFRVPEYHAIINRMGFNNRGVNACIPYLKKRTYSGIVGVNIGKNKDTAIQNAVDDYVYCLQQVFPYADYVTVNISSPNTPDLRALQTHAYFDGLVKTLRHTQQQLSRMHKRIVPLLIKISPDETEETLTHMVETLVRYDIDGVIATNTTVDKSMLLNHPLANEAGGLSGFPVKEKSFNALTFLKQALQARMPVISVGGIASLDDAKTRFEHGASLIQVYTGLIYEGPSLIKHLATGIL